MNTMTPIVNLFRLEQQLTQSRMQGNYAEVLAIYDAIIQIKEQLPNRLGLAKSLSEKAFVLEQLGMTGDALKTYRASAAVANGTPNRQFLEMVGARIGQLEINSRWHPEYPGHLP